MKPMRVASQSISPQRAAGGAFVFPIKGYFGSTKTGGSDVAMLAVGGVTGAVAATDVDFFSRHAAWSTLCPARTVPVAIYVVARRFQNVTLPPRTPGLPVGPAPATRVAAAQA